MPDSVMETRFPNGKPVTLMPMEHQVGGHTPLLHFNDTTLCKPLSNREYHFYTNLPADIQHFTPQFKGIIEVQLFEDEAGYTTLVGYPPNHLLSQTDEPATTRKSFTERPQCHCRRSDNSNDNDSSESSHGAYSVKHAAERGNDEELTGNDLWSEEMCVSPKSGVINPWSLHCHKQQIAKMKKMQRNTDVYKFLMLENVITPLVRPCILDLKMGTRQHGDDHSEDKRCRFIIKCKKSTSATLGLRISGMQVYQIRKNNYICKDKYQGMSLTESGLKQALRQFLHNGERLRTDILPHIVRKLRQLHRTIERHDTFRFYSGSLLILYDGHTPCDACDEAEPRRTAGDASRGSSRAADFVNCSVDVRMIDFAHSTYYDYPGDQLKHYGPDHGYLFGLTNLMDYFLEIHQQETH